MAPGLPFLMRSIRYSSLRLLPASFGALPPLRPPLSWQKPHKVPNICWPSMSLGEASGAGASDLPAWPGAGTWACCAGAAIGGTESATHTNAAAPNFRGIAGRCSCRALLRQREHHQRAGVLRHALVGLAVKAGIGVGHHAAPPGRDGDVLLAAGAVADDAAVVADAVVVRPQLLAGLGVVG